MAFAYPFIGLTMVSSRALQAISIAWPMILITFTRVIILQCSLTYLFIVVLGYKDVAWAWYAISVSCIFAGIIAYLMRLYFVNKLKEI
jgi:Na+-driven multidrug efflux pump